MLTTTRGVRGLVLAALVAGALLPGAGVGPAGAQVFLSTEPRPAFTIGPLFIRATVTPALGPVTVDVLWSLVIPPTQSALELAQDLFLLWPGAVDGGPSLGKPDPDLARQVEARGFSVIDEGRLPLSAHALFQADGDRAIEALPGGAPYVTFVREGGALGLTAPVTYVRIPWTPSLVNRARLMNLRLVAKGLVKPRLASFIENAFRGPRYLVTLSFHDVRPRGMFPLYVEHRDRVIRLADEPSQLVLNFTDADHLKIDHVVPATSSRNLSETLESTEVVSLFLDHAEGMSPQILSVQFGYFSGMRAWTPVLIPTLFFLLGNLAGPIIRFAAQRIGRRLSSAFQLGSPTPDDHRLDRGVILPRQTIERIVPGVTTYDDVIRLAGRDVEELEQLASPERRTLVYRGRRVVPQRVPIFRWLARVKVWDVEHHEVEIALEGNVVRDVQARVRRGRLPEPSLSE